MREIISPVRELINSRTRDNFVGGKNHTSHVCRPQTCKVILHLVLLQQLTPTREIIIRRRDILFRGKDLLRGWEIISRKGLIISQEEDNIIFSICAYRATVHEYIDR